MKTRYTPVLLILKLEKWGTQTRISKPIPREYEIAARCRPICVRMVMEVAHAET
jgi:hypothetical protein